MRRAQRAADASLAHEGAFGEAPVEDVQGAVGAGGHVGVVRDEHDGLAAVAQALEDLHDDLAGGRVEVAGGLVGQDDGRVAHEGARDGHALHLTAGKLVDLVVEVVDRQVDGGERRHGTRLALAHGDVAVDERQHDVPQHRGARQQVEALEHEADALPAHEGEVVVGKGGDVHALEPVGARGGRVEQTEDVHEGRLA